MELNREEEIELKNLKIILDFSCIMRNAPHRMSVKGHYHTHLLKLYDDNV
jgi:hypothetical protein